jgi:hypothetical protein
VVVVVVVQGTKRGRSKQAAMVVAAVAAVDKQAHPPQGNLKVPQLALTPVTLFLCRLVAVVRLAQPPLTGFRALVVVPLPLLVCLGPAAKVGKVVGLPHLDKGD